MSALSHWISPLENHLWQSTAFAACAWLLALLLRKNQARVRYWIWLAASLKFLVPFSLLFAVGVYLRPARVVAIAPAPIAAAVQQIAQPFQDVASVSAFAAPVDAHDSNIPLMLLLLWACGLLAVSFSWWRRWRRVRKTCRDATPALVHSGVPVMLSSSLLEPGVFGVFQPVLMLPAGIGRRLTSVQMDAILAHEMCHIRRRDNLTAALHMFVEAVFWFHPMVWWIGARLVEERENACDEEVMRLGAEAEALAGGIIEVCKSYAELPIVCVSGISGSKLKGRIVRIMTQHFGSRLTWSRKSLLVIVSAAATVGPVVFGIMNARPLQGQTSATGAQSQQVIEGVRPSFEVASIKPAKPPFNPAVYFSPAGFRAPAIITKELIILAYNVKGFQVSGLPEWADSTPFDVETRTGEASAQRLAKSSPEDRAAQIKLMLRPLLADRFALRIHRGTKDAPMFVLTVGQADKLQQSHGECSGPNPPRGGAAFQRGVWPAASCVGFRLPGRIAGLDMPLSALVDDLSYLTNRIVVDKTGLEGNYDITLDWTPEAPSPPLPNSPFPQPDANGPTLEGALEDQLGLKLVSTRGPVDMIIVDHIQKPSEN